MQRIEIKNFGPIKELDLEIQDFSLLIGPQASGKSTIAKTIFFFKSLNDDLVKYFIDALDKNEFKKHFNNSYGKIVRQKFLDYFGASTHLNSLQLKYYYSDDIWISITLETNHKYITPEFSESLLKKIKKIIWEVKDFSQSINQRNPSLLTSKDLLQLDTDKRKFINQIKQKCNSIFEEDRELIFIPAGRSLLATLSEQLQYVNSRSLDFLMRTFLDKINIVRPIFNKSLSDIIKERRLLTQQDIDYETTKLAEEIITKILKGKYQFDKDGEKIFYTSKNYVKLSFSSSGQQESLWILLLLFIIVLEKQNVFIVIEEPEAHLFPEAQKEISNLIALLFNIKNSQVFITTHSPYILASINNLILAHQVGQSNRAEVSKKINKNLWINRQQVFAAMVQNGLVTDIIDKELNIIQQEKIDSVSSIINNEFDFLFQFETE
ncbi:AAA family ATPase [Flavobacterium sp. WV_118_3]|uniref:AAA family ATPase n=1 Tax=Flavobacterium sp. WV_118_3 TaxID=3151764 RepID=UPI00321997D8